MVDDYKGGKGFPQIHSPERKEQNLRQHNNMLNAEADVKICTVMPSKTPYFDYDEVFGNHEEESHEK